MSWKSQRLAGEDGKGGKEGEKLFFFLTVLKMMVVIWVTKTREEIWIPQSGFLRNNDFELPMELQAYRRSLRGNNSFSR